MSSQRVSRGFHRLGLSLAAILLVVGLAAMAADAVHLRLWDVSRGELPTTVFGVVMAMTGLALACLALYGLIRAIGWVIGGFAAS